MAHVIKDRFQALGADWSLSQQQVLWGKAGCSGILAPSAEAQLKDGCPLPPSLPPRGRSAAPSSSGIPHQKGGGVEPSSDHSLGNLKSLGLVTWSQVLDSARSLISSMTLGASLRVPGVSVYSSVK